MQGFSNGFIFLVRLLKMECKDKLNLRILQQESLKIAKHFPIFNTSVFQETRSPSPHFPHASCNKIFQKGYLLVNKPRKIQQSYPFSTKSIIFPLLLETSHHKKEPETFSKKRRVLVKRFVFSLKAENTKKKRETEA